MSAEHNEGLNLLYDALSPYLSEQEETSDAAEIEAEPGEATDPEERHQGPLQLAIVGRPNVGKSTLVNRLLGEERVLTGPEPGVTRDAIAVHWEWDGRPIRLIDTAGLRRNARVVERIEKMSVDDTMRAVRFAQVVVLVLDAEGLMEKQDLSIASLVVQEGRALIIALNKWDLVSDPNAAIRAVQDRLEISLPQVRGVPVVPLSALTGSGVDRMMKAVFTHL